MIILLHLSFWKKNFFLWGNLWVYLLRSLISIIYHPLLYCMEKLLLNFLGMIYHFLGLLGRKHLMDSASLRLWLFCFMGEKGLNVEKHSKTINKWISSFSLKNGETEENFLFFVFWVWVVFCKLFSCFSNLWERLENCAEVGRDLLQVFIVIRASLLLWVGFCPKNGGKNSSLLPSNVAIPCCHQKGKFKDFIQRWVLSGSKCHANAFIAFNPPFLLWNPPFNLKVGVGDSPMGNFPFNFQL